MIWDGLGVYTLWGYQPITTLAINWARLANGNYAAQDRGIVPIDQPTGEDVYQAAINFKGTATSLETLETALADNRGEMTIACSEGEEIFGADVDYSSDLTVTVEKYGRIDSIAAGVYAMPLLLRCIGPTFTGTASIASLRCGHRFSPNSAFSVVKQFALSGAGTYLDRETDDGIFSATFVQTTAEMKAIRRYLSTTARTAIVPLPSIGVSYPFGRRMGTGPFTCRVLEWKDLGRKNYRDWELEITFARVYA